MESAKYKEYYRRPEIQERWKSEEFKTRTKIYRDKPKAKQIQQAYHQNNKKRLNKRLRDRYKTDPNYRLRVILRSKFHKVLKGIKTSHTNTLGCDLAFLKNWLEFRFDENMSWENFGSYWHIDHILPVSKFDFTEERSKFICFHWANLQPLPGPENQSKHNNFHLHYFFNNIVNVFRFNRKYKQFLGHEALSEMIAWLGVMNPSIVTAPRIDKCN